MEFPHPSPGPDSTPPSPDALPDILPTRRADALPRGSLWEGQNWMAFLFFILLVTPHSQSQSPREIKTTEEKIREDMVRISRELGVTCNACHINENFKDDRLTTFKVAREHLKITQLLIDNGFDGKNGRPMATCYMCHRGVLKPDYIEKKNPLISGLKHLWGAPKNHSTPFPESRSLQSASFDLETKTAGRE